MGGSRKHPRCAAGSGLCPVSIIFCHWSGKDLWQLFGSVIPFENIKQYHFFMNVELQMLSIF